MKRTTITIAAVALFALAVSAGQPTLFERYETTRQALLSGALADVQRTAKDLAGAARATKQNAIAERAAALAAATNLKDARSSFATLSDALIQYRAGLSGQRPVVVYCSMEKKSWLQPKGAVTNPYVSPSMRSCGEVREDKVLR